MARPVKRIKTHLEKLIRKVWKETKKGSVIVNEEQSCVIGAVNETLEYFETEDFLYGTDRVKIFKAVYLEPLKYGKTRTGLALELHIGETTLKRVSNIFMRCFQKKLRQRLL